MRKPRRLAAGLALAAAATLVLLAPRPAGAGGAEWTELAPAGGGFTVMLPGTPRESSMDVSTDLGTIKATTYTLELAGDHAYMIVHSDFPREAMKQVKSDAILDSARDGAVANVKGKLKSEKKIKLGFSPGRALVVESSDGSLLLNARVYLVKERLYQAIVVNARAKVVQADVDRFLGSFKLAAKKGPSKATKPAR